jgi:LPXTG-site transpeptidase (sortase) family protein
MRIRNASTLIAACLAASLLLVIVLPVSAASYYSTGPLSGQNGWDGGNASGASIPFNNTAAGAADVVNTQAHTGSQSWLFANGGGSPGAGTPFSPAVVTVGAPNEGATGDMVVISFAFKAAQAGDGSRISIYEGAAKRDDRTGSNIYLETTSSSTVHLYMVPAVQESPYNGSNFDLGTYAADSWHVVVMTTVYPTTDPSNMSSFGMTTYAVDGQTVGSATPWPHWWRYMNGVNEDNPAGYPYAPGSSLKFSNFYNDASHHGFYFDDVSFRVIKTSTHATVGAFSTSFENVGSAPVVSSAPVTGSYTTSFHQIIIPFSEALNDPAGNNLPDDATNIANYLLLQKGSNGVYDTVECSTGVQGDDVKIPITSATYTNESGVGPQVTLAINGNSDLAVGDYRLIVCGTTSIVDTNGAPLNGEPGTDSQYDFSVQTATATPTAQPTKRPTIPQTPTPLPTTIAQSGAGLPIPITGFAPGNRAVLPAQNAAQQYADLGDLWLEIPALGVERPIVGVPQNAQGWDVSWLGDDIGWLNGTAYPTWQGNSVLTGHVYDANGQPGPFVGLDKLKWGDQVIVHAFGAEYIYEVREVSLIADQGSARVVKHEDDSWLTLLTCSGYDSVSGTYLFHQMVRAAFVKKQ